MSDDTNQAQQVSEQPPADAKYTGLPSLSYATYRASIRDADILLFVGKSIIDKAIQQGTKSPFSHCAMTFWWNDRLLVAESIINYGVRVLPLSDYIKTYDGTMYLCRHSAINRDNARLIQGVSADYLGHPYGIDEIMDILGHLTLGMNSYRSTEALICSEYIAVVFNKGGVPFTCDTGGYWFPRTIASCPYVSPLGVLIP